VAPDESPNRAYGAGSTREEHTAPVLRELAEMIQLERQLVQCKTNEERYHVLLVVIDRELPHALTIHDPDPSGKSPQHREWLEDMNAMRKIQRDYENLKPPVMPRPFFHPLMGYDPPVYQVSLPGNVHIGDAAAEDLDKLLPVMLKPDIERAYHEAASPWRTAKVRIREVLSRWGIWASNLEIAMTLSSYTDSDIDRELGSAATRVGPKEEPEVEEEEEPDLGMDEEPADF
jgi:hypothetical protein